MNAELLDKYIAGNASQEETKEVVDWIEQSDENMREYMAHRKLYDITLWRTKEISDEEDVPARKSTVRVVFTESLKIAAILIIAILGTYYYINNKNPKVKNVLTFQSVYSPSGQRAEVTLEDGTHVWLNANSKITYPSNFEKEHRNITLQGEAYFKVTPNVHRPFIVNAQGFKIKVLGTEFNVVAYNKKDCEVDLLKGSVHITTPDNQVADLKPGERIFSQNNLVVKGQILHPDYFRWREGLICFDDISIRDMVEKLKLYYGVNIKVNNKEILSYRYTGKFWTSDGVEQVLRVLQLDHKFTYKRDEENNKFIIN